MWQTAYNRIETHYAIFNKQGNDTKIVRKVSSPSKSICGFVYQLLIKTASGMVQEYAAAYHSWLRIFMTFHNVFVITLKLQQIMRWSPRKSRVFFTKECGMKRSFAKILNASLRYRFRGLIESANEVLSFLSRNISNMCVMSIFVLRNMGRTLWMSNIRLQLKWSIFYTNVYRQNV